MDREFYEITIKQANGSLKTALQNQVQADIGGTREEADRAVNNILDILDAHKIYSVKEENCTSQISPEKQVDNLILYIFNNLHWCPFKDETDIDFEKECVGFQEPGCKDCMLRNIEKLN